MLLFVSACGDDGRGSAEGHADGIAGQTGDNVGDEATGEGHDEHDGQDTDDDAGGGSTSTTGDGDGDPTTGDGDPNGDGDGPGGPKWDLAAIPDANDLCGPGGGDLDFSYLWAANSSQGTISKIDTHTVTEVGRYMVRPDGSGSPSRTSVSLSGDVAVASRNGGVTKIYARPESCVEVNGIPGLQTSNDANYLPWGLEECVAWHKPMNYASQRPVAWGPGEFNAADCSWTDEELWTAGTNQDGRIDIYVLDGDDGSTKELLSVPTGGAGLTADFFGLYGAAVDGDGNFWGSQLGSNGRLIRVKREDMTYEIWDTPSGPHWYGMTVDAEGMVWLCSSTVGRFDPATETWTTAAVGGWTGCMADAHENGLLWLSNGAGVVGVNRDTLAVEKTWVADGSYGISIDFEGYVWAVANGDTASKIDPNTGEYWTYDGLVGAYTYSDMTGYALTNVGTPSG